MPINLLIDKYIPFIKGIFEPIVKKVHYQEPEKINHQFIKKGKFDAMLIRTRTKANEQLLQGTNVKFIATTTIGNDHLDIQYLEKNNIYWAHCPNCNSNSVHDYVVAVLLEINKKLKLNLKQLTLGLIGYGNIGKKVYQTAKALGMKVIINDPPLEQRGILKEHYSLEQLLTQADIITLHTPYQKQGEFPTHHLINKNNLRLTKNDVIIINTARGPVISNEDLIEHIKNNKQVKVILDVFENEPKLNQELLNACFLATPHIAGYSTDGKAEATKMTFEQIKQFYRLNIKLKMDLPSKKKSLITINKQQDLYNTLYDIIHYCYDIQQESQELKDNPHKFEQLRNEYQVRRDFDFYQIKLNHHDSKLIHILKTLRFKVI